MPKIKNEIDKLSPAMQEYIRSLEAKNEAQLKSIEIQQTQITELKDKIDKLNIQLNNLTELLVKNRRSMFGQSSEQSKYIEGMEQYSLFNEAEKESKETAPEPDEKTMVPAHERKKKRSKEKLTEGLPHYEVVCDLPENEQRCLKCGNKLVYIGKEKIRSELLVIPQQMAVLDYYQLSYKCVTCEKETGETFIVKGEVPRPVMKKSMASAATVAYVMQEKYVNGVPLFRQEKYWKSKGIELNRNTLANWVIRSSAWFEPLWHRLREILLSGDIVHGDETNIHVLKEDGRAVESMSKMWTFCTGAAMGRQVVLYKYHPSRAGKVADEMLKDYCGYLISDGYQGYNAVAKAKRTGCWSHARRYWVECLPKGVNPGGSNAAQALAYIDKLFKFEEELATLSPEERSVKREKLENPILDAYWKLIDSIDATKGSNLYKAVQYSLNQKEYLMVYMTDGRLEATNNRAERCIKPFVMSRRNFLFSDTAKGADASALCFSIIETAKANSLDVFGYLTYLLLTMPKFGSEPTVEQLNSVLPWSGTLPGYCRKGSLVDVTKIVR